MVRLAVRKFLLAAAVVAAWGFAESGASAQFRLDSGPPYGSAGFEVRIMDWLAIGFASRYHSGLFHPALHFDGVDRRPVTLVTYLGAVFSENLSAELGVGRSVFGLITPQGLRLADGSSNFEPGVPLAVGNLTYGRSFGDWRLSARGGLFWLRDRRHGPADSNPSALSRPGQSLFNVGRAKLSGEIARMFGGFEPFASATYRHSFTPSLAGRSFGQDIVGSDVARADVLVGVGARYFGSEVMSGSLEFNTLLGRHYHDNYSINLLIRADF